MDNELPPNVITVKMPKTEAGNDLAAYKNDPEAVAQFDRTADAALTKEKESMESKDSSSRLIDRVTTMDLKCISTEPVKREMIADYFPARATSAIAAMGGAGKTTWLVHLAIETFGEDEEIEIMFMSAEDELADYQNKVYNALYSVNHGKDEVYTLTRPEQVAGRLHILDMKGLGTKLVIDNKGCFTPSPATDQIINLCRESYPKVRMMFIETTSRFGGGEDNERLEALISATDRIAIALNGAVVLVHHVSQEVARNDIVDLYSGRGSTVFGDNTRCMIILSRIKIGGIIRASPKELQGGLFSVEHVRSSYSATLATKYFAIVHGLKHGVVLEERFELTADEIEETKVNIHNATHNVAAGKILDLIEKGRGKLAKRSLNAGTKKRLGISQGEVEELLDAMINNNVIEEFTEGSQSKKMIRKKVSGNETPF